MSYINMQIPIAKEISLKISMKKIQILTSALLIKILCAMVKSRYIGDGHPTFNDGILISWVYKPLRTWVDEFIPYYMEIMGVGTCPQLSTSLFQADLCLSL